MASPASFLTLPRDERAAIVRSLAAEGKGRSEIARIVGSHPGSIDSLCAAYKIKTFAPRSGGHHANVHPGWEKEPAEQRDWFRKMDQKFCRAMEAANG